MLIFMLKGQLPWRLNGIDSREEAIEFIKKLLDILQAFVNTGNTVVVIEHNLDVIKTADHIIDMGPEGGESGGEIVAEGPPEKVSNEKLSYTGQFLKDILNINKMKKTA